jgi:phytoene dehydrogenase-like protein
MNADAIVVGAGPNGLAAAIALAQKGRAVTVYEAAVTTGGGTRTAELTLPGFRHDVCSAVHPLALSSPFFSALPLREHGLEWLQPDLPLAHPFDDGSAIALYRSVDDTAQGLGPDAEAYRRLMTPLAARWPSLSSQLLGPLFRPPHDPFLMARFGLNALRSARGLAEGVFKGYRARALFAGLAAHSTLSLESPFTAGFGLTLGAAAHSAGWPVAKGGSQSIADALESCLRSLGGEIVTGRHIESLDALPAAPATLLDLTPRQVVRLAGHRFSKSYHDRLTRYRYGAGAFKVDYALAGPIPWRASECCNAGTVHLGGALWEIAASEAAVARGGHPERPYVLLAQQSIIDPSRAPAGKHTVWAYCHVPNGSRVDMTERIEAQIERFAPCFRDLVMARHSASVQALQAYNENYIGGDISGGAPGGRQLFFRPVASLNPYRAAKGIYICSASTPPGAGVHGMCGYYAAQAALRDQGTPGDEEQGT